MTIIGMNNVFLSVLLRLLSTMLSSSQQQTPYSFQTKMPQVQPGFFEIELIKFLFLADSVGYSPGGGLAFVSP